MTAAPCSADLIASIHDLYIQPEDLPPVPEYAASTECSCDEEECQEAPDGVTSAILTIRCTYTPAQPYIVELEFPGIPKSPQPWAVGRDLLIEGAQTPSGHGDVHIATVGLADGDVTILTLSTPQRTAVFTFRAQDLIEFLVRTEELVPLGAESDQVQRDLSDQALRDLTAQWERGHEGGHDHPSGRWS